MNICEIWVPSNESLRRICRCFVHVVHCTVSKQAPETKWPGFVNTCMCGMSICSGENSAIAENRINVGINSITRHHRRNDAAPETKRTPSNTVMAHSIDLRQLFVCAWPLLATSMPCATRVGGMSTNI